MDMQLTFWWLQNKVYKITPVIVSKIIVCSHCVHSIILKALFFIFLSQFYELIL